MVALVSEVCLLNGFNGTNEDTGLPFDYIVLCQNVSFWRWRISFLSVRDENFHMTPCISTMEKGPNLPMQNVRTDQMDQFFHWSALINKEGPN